MSEKVPLSLDKIRKPVETELENFEKLFRQTLRSSVPLVNLIARYITRQRGKRVRPLLIFLSAKLCGAITQRTFNGALLVELLHTATLIHDDVVDNADTRRGVASINAIWNNKIAVIMGDFLLSRGLLTALEHGDIDFLKSTSHAARRMTEGELLQLQKSRQLNITEETYIEIIRSKTAALFASCTEIGAASVTKNPTLIERLRLYGEKTGMVFQIRDDILDYTGSRSSIGKPTVSDIRDKKITLPLLLAMKNASPSDAKHALSIIKKGIQSKSIQWLLQFINEHRGIESSIEYAEAFAQEALALIAPFDNSDAKESLQEFVTFSLYRKK
ncbi:MAG: polyprenyl synthetase family protein [Bacteroidetes bacterium]|nr:polyprenyl synthetase family protein [Bacteroidota bacterium]